MARQILTLNQISIKGLERFETLPNLRVGTAASIRF